MWKSVFFDTGKIWLERKEDSIHGDLLWASEVLYLQYLIQQYSEVTFEDTEAQRNTKELSQD